jgi:glycosyltransferase involved in cell wall biosynthesis
MRIAIDARLNAYRIGGISAYTRQIATAMAAQTSDDLLFLQHRSQQRPLVVAPHTRRVTLYTPPHHRFENWTLPLEISRLRLDVLHCPDFIAPRHRPCPAVVTIHDLAFLRFPAILDADARRYYAQVRTTVRHADAIIAVSRTTRDDICALLDVPPERVDVVYEAADPMFAPQPVPAGTVRLINRQRLAADQFMLFVSTLEPRKNIPTLLRGLQICRDRMPATPYHLVLAGARGWLDQPVFDAIRELQLTDQVTVLGSVSRHDLRWLYNACRFYVNPSLYEGFGLPLLEALVCGAPALASDIGSLREVGGEAACFVPTGDEAAWADAIDRLWHDADERNRRSASGTVQAGRFAWQHAAQATLAIYRRVARR